MLLSLPLTFQMAKTSSKVGGSASSIVVVPGVVDDAGVVVVLPWGAVGVESGPVVEVDAGGAREVDVSTAVVAGAVNTSAVFPSPPQALTMRRPANATKIKRPTRSPQ
jgi:hypothetical protein